MSIFRCGFGFCLAISLTFLTSVTRADELRFHSLFNDGAVLQMEQPVPVWGWPAKTRDAKGLVIDDMWK